VGDRGEAPGRRRAPHRLPCRPFGGPRRGRPAADPERVAQELLAQAEHDPEAAVAAVTWDAALLERIRTATARRLADAPRREVAAEAFALRGAFLLTKDHAEALAFAEAYAAEHLSLMTDDPRADLETQTIGGARSFSAKPASVAFGDYMTGANHVLPTSGRSRSFSGLSVLDFLRFFTWQEARDELEEVLEEWVLFRVSRNLPLPTVNGIKLQIRRLG
jgi:histidinol dehydrogenase